MTIIVIERIYFRKQNITVGPSTEVTISIAVPTETKGQTNTEQPAKEEKGKQEELDNVPVNEAVVNDKEGEIVSDFRSVFADILAVNACINSRCLKAEWTNIQN